jgi:hypothetical protein
MEMLNAMGVWKVNVVFLKFKFEFEFKFKFKFIFNINKHPTRLFPEGKTVISGLNHLSANLELPCFP